MKTNDRARRGLRFLPIAALAFGVAGAVFAQDALTPVESDPANDAPIPEPETTASVEASVDDIQSLINLPPTGQLGKESDEDITKHANIFANTGSQEMKYIYFPEGVDPMIIPWIREQIVAAELMEKAKALEAAKDYSQALVIVQEVAEKYPETPEGRNAPTVRSRIQGILAAQASGSSQVTIERPPEGDVELPTPVRINTNGIIVMGSKPKVLVFDFILGEGDTVPRYTAVRVKKITEGEVTYEYQGQEFKIQVDGRF